MKCPNIVVNARMKEAIGHEDQAVDRYRRRRGGITAVKPYSQSEASVRATRDVAVLELRVPPTPDIDVEVLQVCGRW